MPSRRQKLGRLAEAAAADWLRGQGYAVVDTHVTSRYGEIDILCRHGTALVAVEVKLRRSRSFGPAVEAITPRKLERLAQAVFDIAERRRLPVDDVRIDVITLDPGSVPGHYQIGHYLGVGG